MSNNAEHAILRPGVGSSYSNGWQKMKKYFLELLLIIIIALVVSAPTAISQNPGAIGSIFIFAYSLLIIEPVGYGVSFAYLKAARGNQPQAKDILEVFQNYLNAVLASILAAVIIGIGLVLLVVPGIIFACKLAFTPFLVVDRRMEAIEAIKESWRMTGGHAGKVFLIGLLAIPIAIAGLICLGVGIFPAIMWIYLAFATLYHSVSSTYQKPEQPEVSAQ